MTEHDGHSSYGRGRLRAERGLTVLPLSPDGRLNALIRPSQREAFSLPAPGPSRLRNAFDRLRHWLGSRRRPVVWNTRQAADCC